MSWLRLTCAALLLGGGTLLAACASNNPAPRPADRMSLPVAGRAAFYIRVEHGQSLERIVQAYRATKREIIAANNLAFPYSLKPGTLLEVPLHSASPVKKAEKWSKIAVATKASPQRHQRALANLHPARPVMKLAARTIAAPRRASAQHRMARAAARARPIAPRASAPLIIPLDERPDNLIEARSDESGR
jgi:murein DD-endopeptidase MepM/ murein hydrolase activator NlpD